MKHIMAAIIRLYRRFISPLKPPSCRFSPTCSSYSLSAYESWGFFSGTLLAVIRIIRCSPLSAGGADPLPEDPYKLK